MFIDCEFTMYRGRGNEGDLTKKALPLTISIVATQELLGP